MLSTSSSIDYDHPPSLPPSPSHRYSLEAAAVTPPLTRCEQVTNTLKWAISLPFKWNLIAQDNEHPIIPFSHPTGTIYIVTRGVNYFLHFSRQDSSETGMFVEKRNVMLPIVEQIIHHCDQTKGQSPKKISPNDFLLTSEPEQALRFRKVIFDFLHSINNAKTKSDLESVIEGSMATILDPVDADEFCGTFATTIIARNFFDHPGPQKSFREIQWALSQIDQHIEQTHLEDPVESEQYCRAMAILAEAIELAEMNATGSFVDFMTNQSFTETQIQSTIFLLYFTSYHSLTNTLKYLFWQLGQHPEYQSKFFESSSNIEKDQLILKALAEALRLAPPIERIERYAARDLKYSIKKNKKEIYSTLIPKGSLLLTSPHIQALNPKQFPNPNNFDPDRFTMTSTFTEPFGSGFHKCPAKGLACAEMTKFALRILERYQITSYPEESEANAHLFTCLHLPKKVQLQFNPIPKMRFLRIHSFKEEQKNS